MKKAIIGLFIGVMLVGMVGCGSASDQTITFSELISKADEYNGKTVTLEAFYFSGFEISALSGSVGPATSGEWRIVPTGTLVWVQGGIPQELQDKLYAQTMTTSGYTERIGRLKLTGEFKTGKLGHLDAYEYRITITQAEILDWTPPPGASASGMENGAAEATATVEDEMAEARTAGQKTAEEFIRNSSTFRYDGIEGSLKFIKDDPGYTSAFRSWMYTFEFQTRHPGHGDRTGQPLTEYVTTHRATVMVKLGDGWKIVTAVCDNTWDMINEKDLPVTIRGVVISGGDTTPPDGPLDAPRKLVYKVIREEGWPVNVSYTAYPPSPLGDAMRAKITLDFYGGEVKAGDRIEARGTLDTETNTLAVMEQGDYIRTFVQKARVVGVVMSIKEEGGNGDARAQYVYELMRDDGTYVNIRCTTEAGAAQSLYSETVKPGDFMKAEGTYDKGTNTVTVGEGDMIKTYDHNPVRTPAVWE